MDKYLLSVIIITKDEQENIRDCLESVKWADDIAIVDSGSTDNTEAICRDYTDRFYQKDWPGFGVQKQRALELAKHNWVLSIDADERVTLELQQEIVAIISGDAQHTGYHIPRLSHYLNKEIRHAGWYPDYVLRLVKKDHSHFSRDIVHERLIVEGEVSHLSNHLIHFPYKDIAHHLQKLNQYSTLSAQKMFERDKRVGWTGVFAKALFGFIRSYVLRRGFLDGWPGLVVSVSTALSVYFKYVKLKEMQLKTQSQ